MTQHNLLMVAVVTTSSDMNSKFGKLQKLPESSSRYMMDILSLRLLLTGVQQL